MVFCPLPQPSNLKVATSILATCKLLQKHYQLDVRNAITMKRKVIRPIRSSCRHGPPHSFLNTNRQARWKQHWKRGERKQVDSNPCGQSPMDFESISLSTRTHCFAEYIEHLLNVCGAAKFKARGRRLWL
jgi:hypothetical protein